VQKLIAYCDICGAQVPEEVKGINVMYYYKNRVYDAECETSSNERLDLCNKCAMEALTSFVNKMGDANTRLEWVRKVKTDKRV
jgi:hypothetical protein